MTEWLNKIDFSVLYRIQQTLRCDFLDFFFRIFTHLGDFGAIWIVTAAVLLFCRRTRRTGIRLFVGLLAGFLVGNLLIKNLVARPRPCWLDPTVSLLIPVPADFSFPSGHALSSAAAATVLSGSGWRAACLSVPVALLIAFSRLYLFVHFPSDVLAGIVIGFLIGLGTLFFRRGAQDRAFL